MKAKTILSIMLAGTLFCSCHGDLDVVQNSEISTNSMWQEEGDATSAMYGMYNQFRSTFSNGLVYWGEYRTGLWTDGLAGQSARTQVYQNQIPNDHGYANWKDLYTTINNANLILKYTPGITFSNEDSKNYVLANAYYVRAFCYYWIARVWGDAPILLDGFESDQQEGLYPTRQPVAQVFQQVESDINNALSLMPAGRTDKYTASTAAVNMLKADYNLWMYKVQGAGDTALSNANEAVQAVLSDSNYGLEDDFSNIFYSEAGKEIIFAWSYLQDEYEGGYPSDYLVPVQYITADLIENPIKVGSHQQWCFYTDDYKAFLSENENDQRTIMSFQTCFDEGKNETFQWINKFSGTWVNSTRVFDSDVIAYRYADAVLFDAEIKMAQNNTAGAVAALNRIASRAYGVDNFYPTSLTGDALNEAIVDERMKEFAAEGKLWWDFIRLGVVFEKSPYLVGRENELNVLLWPVSQTSINQNPNITQTPGYDQ